MEQAIWFYSQNAGDMHRRRRRRRRRRSADSIRNWDGRWWWGWKRFLYRSDLRCFASWSDRDSDVGVWWDRRNGR